jgi:hypothetical protein
LLSNIHKSADCHLMEWCEFQVILYIYVCHFIAYDFFSISVFRLRTQRCKVVLCFICKFTSRVRLARSFSAAFTCLLRVTIAIGSIKV